MIYIIDEKMNFRTEDGYIWDAQDESSALILTITTARLLTLLIENKGEVLSRDKILGNVWDAHGLRSSNNSLNKYISDLRGIFRSMGFVDNVIITVPRIGFMLTDNILIKEKSYAQPEETTLQNSKGMRKWFKRICLFLLFVIFFSITVLSVHHWFNLINFRHQPSMGKNHQIGIIDKCPVYVFKPIPPRFKEVNQQIILNILNSERISCPTNAVIYAQIADPIYHGATGRVYLSICSNDNNNIKFLSCINIYESNYESPVK